MRVARKVTYRTAGYFASNGEFLKRCVFVITFIRISSLKLRAEGTSLLHIEGYFCHRIHLFP